MVLGRRRRWKGNPWGGGYQGGDPIIAGLFARSQIAGRDGSLTILRNTERVCPIDGQLKSATGASAVALTSANACTAQLGVGGLTLPMVGVFGQRTNLVAQSNGNASPFLFTNTVNGDGSYRGTRTTTGTGNYLQTVVSGIAGTYTMRAAVRRVNQDFVTLRIQGTYPNRGDCRFNLAAGTAGTPTSAGTASAPSASMSDLGGGWFLIRLTVTLADAPQLCHLSTGTGTEIDAASANSNDAVDHKWWQCEAAPFPGPYIPTAGSAVTHNADDVRWNISIPGATAYSLVHVWAKYLWQTNSAGRQLGLSRAPAGTAWLIETNPGGPDLGHYGTTGVQAISGTANASASGVVAVSESLFDGTNLTPYFNGSAGAPVASTMNAITSLSIGNETASGNLNREAFALQGSLFVPGGLTAIERTALANAVAGRTLGFVA